MNKIISFGKYKGQTIEEVFVKDKQYIDWLLTQSWFKEKNVNLYTLIVNNFREPQETPEHNAMQIKFLNEEYRLKLAYLLDKDFFYYNSGKLNELIKKYKEKINMAYIENSIKNTIPLKLSSPTFEKDGYDVSFFAEYGLHLGFDNYNNLGGSKYISIKAELKPTVSDDFPAVLRQMKISMPIDSRSINCLIIKEYTGRGATQDEFIEYFKLQGYKVIFEYEIQSIELPEIEKEFIRIY